MEIIAWFILSLLVGLIGNERKIGFWAAFGFSLILSPVIGIIITLVSKNVETEKRENEILETQKKTASLLQEKSKQSIADEITKLHEMKQKGMLSELEYDIAKANLLK